MSDDKKPAIRFKNYSDDWEQRKLGDIASSFEYGLNAAAKEYDGENKYIRITDIDDNTHEFLTDNLTSPDIDLTGADNYKLTEGDILFARTGASVGKSYIYRNSDGLVYYAGFLIRARIKEEYDAEFVFQNTLTDRYNKYIAVTSQRSGQPGVNAQEYAEFEIEVSKKEEQTKIGTYFRNIDHLITLHQRKYDKLQNLKKAMLEKMFPKNGSNVPKIRFKGFTDAWEQRKFSDIALRESATQESSSDLPSVEYEDVISEAGQLNKNICEKETVKKGILFDGTQVLYGKLRPYLHNWLNLDFSGVAVGDWWVLKPVKADKTFLYRLIQTQQFDDIANQSAGSKMPRADWNLVSNTEFTVPVSLEEQAKIGEYFSSLDHLITLHQRKQCILYIMKKLLCGKSKQLEKSIFWEQRKVGDYYEFKNGLNKSKEFFGEGTPIVNFTDVFHNRGIFPEMLSGKVRLELSEIKNYEVKKGDIFFTRTSETIEEIGYPSVMLGEPENTVFSGFVLRGRCFLKDDPLDNLFKKYLFFTDVFRTEMLRKSSMTTRALTSGTAIKNMEFLHPLSKEEQHRIGELLTKLDHLITLHQRKP